MLNKIDSREVYEDKVDRSQWCACNADKACDVCIDDELYGTITTTRQGNSEEAALHALIHCENEQACKFCNPQLPPPPLVIYAHGYMDDEQAAYYEGAK